MNSIICRISQGCRMSNNFTIWLTSWYFCYMHDRNGTMPRG